MHSQVSPNDCSIDLRKQVASSISDRPAGSSVPTEWKSVFEPLLARPELVSLKRFLAAEIESGKVIFPPTDNCFEAFIRCSPSDVKVVIVGQDPYHGPGQAHGLSFSVPHGVPKPPSLRNIFKELCLDMKIATPMTGDLSVWAEQGVLMINSVLTVENGRPNSHAGKGWEVLTDGVIEFLGGETQAPTVFLLWGSFAGKKKILVRGAQHLVLEAPHPSPLSAHRGFLGCGHFSKANSFLRHSGRETIDWSRFN
jgi:uracil-DNA glycosylase